MFKSQILGKTYKTRANYVTQIRNLISKLGNSRSQAEEAINQEKSPVIRIQLNATIKETARRIQQAKEEPLLIQETEE